jgi:NAD(P)-dependent dehydrogenase (short-subunit alcohol dehydrogenase family)
MTPSTVNATGPLDGRHALVTGGGTGIGLGCARRLAADGATVTICGRRREVLDEAVASLGGAARAVTADVTVDDDVAAAVAAACDEEGTLDIVVANAGGAAAAGPLVLVERAAWEQTLALNVTGTWALIRHAAPAMARAGSGSFVALSSIAGHLTHRHLGAYAVAKAAVEMLVRNAADELGAYGIRVNAVRPGLVPTEASGPLNDHEPTRADYLAQMPLGRTGTVEDVAALVAFLAGPEATWITGQLIGVDGGHSLRRGPDLGGLFDPLVGGALNALMGSRPTGAH